MRNGERRAGEEAKGHVDLGLGHHLPVGEAVVELQELQFEKEDRVFGWAPPMGAVGVADQVAEGLKIDEGFDLPQVMVCWHPLLEDQAVYRRFTIVILFQHCRLPSM